MIIRVPEPELMQEEEDIIFCKYKAIVWVEEDIALCLRLLPEDAVNMMGKGIQIIDLWWANGLFCDRIKQILPAALAKSIDKSSVMNRLSIGCKEEFIAIQDDLLNFAHYLEHWYKTLIICRWTIHHVQDPFSTLKLLLSYPQTGLFIKDLIRPTYEKDLEVATQAILSLAQGLDKQHFSYEIIERLTKQSLRAALSLGEVASITNNFPDVRYTENIDSTYFILSRSLSQFI